MRISLALFLICLSTALRAQAPVQTATLPDAPSAILASATYPQEVVADPQISSSVLVTDADISRFDLTLAGLDPAQVPVEGTQKGDTPRPKSGTVLDSAGNPIPLSRQQPQRILGFMPNFRSVSAGSKPHPPGWKYNFKVATRQATDWSSFIFLGITSLSAEGINSHPALGKGADGFYAYTWRGFLDKTDGTYLGAWLLPSLLHEDTRYYAMGNRHNVPVRILYVMSRQVVTRTYGGRQIPNVAGLGAKVLTQIISRYYYPKGSADFGVLATKFAYASMRDIAFTSVREFYPDIAAHYINKHRAKVAAAAAADAKAAGVTPKP